MNFKTQEKTTGKITKKLSGIGITVSDTSKASLTKTIKAGLKNAAKAISDARKAQRVLKSTGRVIKRLPRKPIVEEAPAPAAPVEKVKKERKGKKVKAEAATEPAAPVTPAPETETTNVVELTQEKPATEEPAAISN